MLWDSIIIGRSRVMRVRMPPRMLSRPACGLILGIIAGHALAMEPEFSVPSQVMEHVSGTDSYDLPVGPFLSGLVETRHVEGLVSQTSYQLDAGDLSTLDILTPLRDQITKAGYKIVYDCAADACGGYDFRYAMRVIAEPAMHVDLGDYRFVAATRADPKGLAAISLLVSRSSQAGFVQVIEVLPGQVAPTVSTTSVVTPPTVPGPLAPISPDTGANLTATADIGAALQSQGFVVLEDVVFASGASVLEDGSVASLAALADWLRADPARVVAVVGHTDASGGLAANVALGAKRAGAIRSQLIKGLNVPSAQVSAEGAGYLAPRASNLTDEGRRMNRRVEVILLPPA
jgi:outer membrane protein OmpA-like peptidoglycan-associated protein